MGFIGYDGASLSVKLVWYIALFLRFENPLDMRMLVTINSHGDDLPLSIWQIFLIIYKMAVTRLTLRVLRIFPSTQIIRFDEFLCHVSWRRIICFPARNKYTRRKVLTLIIARYKLLQGLSGNHMLRYHTSAITTIDNFELNQLYQTTFTSEKWSEK